MGLSSSKGSVVARHLVVMDSSNVASIGYSLANRVMEVVFKSAGTIYAYHNVSAEQFAAACSAPSIGHWLKVNLKDNERHPFDRILT